MFYQILPFRRAVILALILFALLTIAHVVILYTLYSYPGYPLDFIWGGRLTGQILMTLEWIALAISLLSFAVVWWRAYGNQGMKAARVMVFLLFIYFAVNTLGNLISETIVEKTLSILSALLAILCLRIALEKTHRKETAA